MVAGLSLLIPESVRSRVRRIVSASELRMMVCGVTELSAEEWKQQAKRAEGVATETWDKFWHIVEGMSQGERSSELPSSILGAAAELVAASLTSPGWECDALMKGDQVKAAPGISCALVSSQDISCCAPELSCCASGLSCCVPGLSCCAPGLSSCVPRLSCSAPGHFCCRILSSKR